jgi:predicted dehydrogenase
MVEQVRLGIIGTGWWADGVLLPAFTTYAPATVVALCGRNRERAAEMAAKYDVPAVFTDYREMYERAGMDGVVVAVPDDLHFPMTMDALERGLHVLCEKPLALTLTDARAMLAKAEDAGVKHMVNLAWRTWPAYQYVKELIDAGYLGQPYQCAFSFIMEYGRDGTFSWGFDQRRSIGVLGNLVPHLADLARWFVGDIASVGALLGTFIARPGPDGEAATPANDAATLVLRFAGGAQGAIQVSAVAHLGDRFMQQRVILHGAQGTLEADLPCNGGWEVRGARTEEPVIRPLPIPERIIGQLDRTQPVVHQFMTGLAAHPWGPRAFVDAIVEDRPAVASFADGVKAQAVIEAAFRSQESGCAVLVE